MIVFSITYGCKMTFDLKDWMIWITYFICVRHFSTYTPDVSNQCSMSYSVLTLWKNCCCALVNLDPISSVLILFCFFLGGGRMRKVIRSIVDIYQQLVTRTTSDSLEPEEVAWNCCWCFFLGSYICNQVKSCLIHILLILIHNLMFILFILMHSISIIT